MVQTVIGPLAALVSMVVAVSLGVRSLRNRPEPVRVPVESPSPRHNRR